jgi:hypothetical protein
MDFLKVGIVLALTAQHNLFYFYSIFIPQSLNNQFWREFFSVKRQGCKKRTH